MNSILYQEMKKNKKKNYLIIKKNIFTKIILEKVQKIQE